jgi:hypothetical protein
MFICLFHISAPSHTRRVRSCCSCIIIIIIIIIKIIDTIILHLHTNDAYSIHIPGGRGDCGGGEGVGIERGEREGPVDWDGEVSV